MNVQRYTAPEETRKYRIDLPNVIRDKKLLTFNQMVPKKGNKTGCGCGRCGMMFMSNQQRYCGTCGLKRGDNA